MRRPYRAQVAGTALAFVLCTQAEQWVPRAAAEPPPAIHERPYEILEVYLSAEEALRLAFPMSGRTVTETVALTPEQAARVAAAADHPVERSFSVLRAMSGDRLDGYGMVTEEIGRFHEITFLVAVTPAGKVKRIEVLVYRESRGGDIRHRRFLRQFEGKSLRDPIRSNRDIVNITGATLSVRAVSRGVRKVLAILREAYGAAS